jgi:hypothetical protein
MHALQVQVCLTSSMGQGIGDSSLEVIKYVGLLYCAQLNVLRSKCTVPGNAGPGPAGDGPHGPWSGEGV